MDNLKRRLPIDLLDVFPKVSHARLPAVGLDQRLQAVVGDGDVLAGQSRQLLDLNRGEGTRKLPLGDNTNRRKGD